MIEQTILSLHVVISAPTCSIPYIYTSPGREQNRDRKCAVLQAAGRLDLLTIIYNSKKAGDVLSTFYCDGLYRSMPVKGW